MKSEVVIYHDETDSGQFKGHVLLFVPTLVTTIDNTPLFGDAKVAYEPRDLFSIRLADIRNRYRLNNWILHFTDISGKTWGKTDIGIRTVIETIVDALRNKRSVAFQQSLHFKVAVMVYPKNSDLSLYGGNNKKEQVLRHKETILRILLKGATHFFYGDDHQILIQNIVSDGTPDHRELSESRILYKLFWEDSAGRQPLRDFVKFSRNAAIIHLSSDHKDFSQQSVDFSHACYLQMADLSLGASLRACNFSNQTGKRMPYIGSRGVSKKDVIAYPFREMMMKARRGKGFRQSGHYRSFAINRLEFSEGQIVFKQLKPAEVGINHPTLDFYSSVD